jgi:hypothetical protein
VFRSCRVRQKPPDRWTELADTGACAPWDGTTGLMAGVSLGIKTPDEG